MGSKSKISNSHVLIHLEHQTFLLTATSTVKQFEIYKINADLSSFVDEQAGVAGDALSSAKVVVVSTVHRSDPDDAIHLLGKFPPLRDSQRRET